MRGEKLMWLTHHRVPPQFSAASTTILDEEPIVNRGLAAALLLCQNKGKRRAPVPAWPPGPSCSRRSEPHPGP